MPVKKSIFDIFEEELDQLIYNNSHFLHQFKNKCISIFGGTGFVGKWLTGCLINADLKLNLNLELKLYTRNKKDFMKSISNFLHKNYQIIEVNFATNNFIDISKSDYYFHLATSSNIKTGSNNNTNVSNSTINVINSTIKNLETSKNPPIFIHASSGAVYGDMKKHKRPVLEQHSVKIGSRNSIYCNTKIKAEKLIQKYSDESLIVGLNPRLFTFTGPHLVLDEHFAVGNFISNALRGESIIIKGDPTTVRSYMYPTDLIQWLIRLALKPTNDYLNFGSDYPVTLNELAILIGKITGNRKIEYLSNKSEYSYYVPSTYNARKNLEIDKILSLDNSIEKWIRWLKDNKSY